jgi:hypothetical protein
VPTRFYDAPIPQPEYNKTTGYIQSRLRSQSKTRFLLVNEARNSGNLCPLAIDELAFEVTVELSIMERPSLSSRKSSVVE